tara:strand:+ start:231 stop:752 length:522 start_codon:yes stop_codon:yes gene_type:complete
MNEQLALDLNFDSAQDVESPIRVREITPTDSDKELITNIGRKIFDESRLSQNRTYSPAAVHQLFDSWVQGAPFFCRIAEKGDEAIGAIVAMLEPCWFSGEKIAYDMFIYVAPEYRGRPTAMRLIKEYERWARANGALEICLGVLTGIHPAQTGSVYERLGYQKVGSNFVKEIV